MLSVASSGYTQAYTSGFAKPYGRLSDKREQNVYELWQRDNEITERRRWLRVVPERQYFARCPKASSAWELLHPECRQRALVKVRFFPHERLTVRAYYEAPKVRRGLNNLRRRRSYGSERSALVKPRETQRTWKILGRWRKIPPATKFTTLSRNLVKDAAHIVETDSVGQGVFVTLTYPGGIQEGYDVVSAGSGAIVNRMNTWLNRHIEGGLYVYVWELQGRGAPHLHYLFRLPIGVNRSTFQADIRRQWRRILLDVCADSGVDLFARKSGGTSKDSPKYPRVQVKKVQRTYVQYLAKYLSKTESKSGGVSSWHPGRWSGVSYAARRVVFRRRFESVVEVGTLADGIAAVKSIGLALQDVALGCKFYSGIPGGDTDAVSLVFHPGFTKQVAESIIAMFGDGDLQPLNIVVDRINSFGGCDSS